MSTFPTVRFQITEPELRKIGLRAVSMIRERTLDGIDQDGKPFEPYSTLPFGMPAGAIPKAVQRKLKGSILYRHSQKSSKLWGIILGGYKAYKEARYGSDSGTVNLTGTGVTMRSLTILEISPGRNDIAGSMTIGLARAQAAEIINYHQNLGVGRRRVLRRIMGFTAAERETLARMAVAAIRMRL